MADFGILVNKLVTSMLYELELNSIIIKKLSPLWEQADSLNQIQLTLVRKFVPKHSLKYYVR